MFFCRTLEQRRLKRRYVELEHERGFLLTRDQRDMELLVLDNLKLAINEGKLITQVPEQKKESKANI